MLLVPAAVDGRTPGPEAVPLLESPLWADPPAVAAGRVHAVPYGASSLGSAFPLIQRLPEIVLTLRG
ncbi:hypothetical protein [Pseudonocardia sp. TRM90224]|uniref:hypothetical protein n=1 Tax=Pseudonocardia sp. TRM90224 TaxID=2812678 RepID=UPI001E31CD2E|nr:hypothetical protein [Pseudonocardia sp. TRM90224]